MLITPPLNFWQHFRNTNGALSVSEGLAIIQIASTIKNDGFYAEFGTYHGKSAMCAAYGLKEGKFFLVDPILEGELIEKVIQNVKQFAHKKLIVGTFDKYSTDVIPLYNDYAYTMIDSGSHQDGLPMQEVKLLEDRMAESGVILFHDFKSQFSEVEEAYNYLIITGKYEEIPIDWESIIAYVNENNLEEGNISWHHNELKNPCFLGAVKRI